MGTESVSIVATRKDGRGGVRAWIESMPPESTRRLAIINNSTNSARHIVIALSYGLYDRHIRKLNQIITSLLVLRMKAERENKTRTVERLNKFMDEIHLAIDIATDTNRDRTQNGEACRRKFVDAAF